jgi:hypothetical protein
MYSADIQRSNFYAQTTPAITLSNNIGLFGTSNVLTITDSNQGLSNTITYYIETQPPIAPSLSISVENSIGEISTCNICGVPVTTTCNFNFWIQTSNIGRYFFNPNPVRAQVSNVGGCNQYSFDSVATTFYSYPNLNSNYSSGTISNTTYFYWSNVTISNVNATTFTTSLNQYSLTVYGSNMTGSGSGSTNFSPYFDYPSLTALNCNVRVQTGITSAITGYNLGTFVYPSVPNIGLTYNNSNSLNPGTTNNYSYEVQLVNGNYYGYGPTNTVGYNNYINYFSNLNANYYNYTGISGITTNFRFVTFL